MARGYQKDRAGNWVPFDDDVPAKRAKSDFIQDIESFVAKWMCEEKLPNLRKLNALELELIADAIFECEKQR